MSNKFRIEFLGTFYTGELYDDKGREIFDLQTAINAAESQYPGQWQSVYNGEEAEESDNLIEE